MVAQSINMLANSCINFISVGRILAGSSALFAPQFAGQFFGIALMPEANIVARLFGVRDVVIGAFLWSARNKVSRAIAKVDGARITDARQDLKYVLWMGMLCDSVDICSCVVAVLAEGMEGKAIGWVGVGAAFFVAAAGVALRRL
jgi:hypothetical protein